MKLYRRHSPDKVGQDCSANGIRGQGQGHSDHILVCDSVRPGQGWAEGQMDRAQTYGPSSGLPVGQLKIKPYIFYHMTMLVSDVIYPLRISLYMTCVI